MGLIVNDEKNQYEPGLFQYFLKTTIERLEAKGYYEALDSARILLSGKCTPLDVLEQVLTQMISHPSEQSEYKSDCRECIVNSANPNISKDLMQRASKALVDAINERNK